MENITIKEFKIYQKVVNAAKEYIEKEYGKDYIIISISSSSIKIQKVNDKHNVISERISLTEIIDKLHVFKCETLEALLRDKLTIAYKSRIETIDIPMIDNTKFNNNYYYTGVIDGIQYALGLLNKEVKE